jgi:hypothetical protein
MVLEPLGCEVERGPLPQERFEGRALPRPDLGDDANLIGHSSLISSAVPVCGGVARRTPERRRDGRREHRGNPAIRRDNYGCGCADSLLTGSARAG